MKRISLTEAARRMNMHPDRLRRLAEDGEIPGAISYTEVFWRFDPEALDAIDRSQLTDYRTERGEREVSE